MLWHDCCQAFWAEDGNGVPEMHRDAQLVSALLWWVAAPYGGSRDSRTHDKLGTYRINNTTTPEEAFDLLNFRFTHNFSHNIHSSLRPVYRLKADVGLEMLEEVFCDLEHDLDRQTSKAAFASTTAAILEKSIINLFASRSRGDVESHKNMKGWMWRLLNILDDHHQHMKYVEQVFAHLPQLIINKLAVGIELARDEFVKVLGLHENVQSVLLCLKVTDSS